MNKILILILTLMTSSAFSQSCKIPKNEKLVIGCSYECKFMYRLRLTLSAMLLGYPIKIVDMRDLGDAAVGLSKVDGVLMPGGADINPELYMNRLTPEMRDYVGKNLDLVEFTKEGELRDPFEDAVLKEYSSNDVHKKLPLLGICRGMQLMTVSEGIPLYLDIKTELGIKNRRNLFDKVTIVPNTLMDSLYKKERISGYKLHHQGLRNNYYSGREENYPNVKVSAYSNDRKIAEAIEYQHRPALGVQFHPEMSFSPTTLPILKWFLRSSCEYKNSVKAVP